VSSGAGTTRQCDQRPDAENGCGCVYECRICSTCDGDGYTETWNDDQSGVVITLCTDCGPGPGDFDA